MRFVIPSRITKRALFSPPLNISMSERQISKRASFAWLPYHVVECIYDQGNRKSRTTLNVSFPLKRIEKKDLHLMFRPNFLRKEKKEGENLPKPKGFSVLPCIKLPTVSIDFRRFSKRVSQLLKDIRTACQKSEGRVIEKYTQGNILKGFYGGLPIKLQESKGGKRREDATFTRNLARKILFTKALQLDGLLPPLQIEGKGLFYYPYLLVAREERYWFIDLVKRGQIFKKFVTDPLLSHLVENYPFLRSRLNREITARREG